MAPTSLKAIQQRSRGGNFSHGDRETLLFLITSSFKNIIENKQTDAVSNREKAAAWDRLAVEFNAVGGSQKNSAQLRKLWQNMKTQTRKNVASTKMSLFKTGGGPPKKPDGEDGQEGMILDVLGATATGLDSEFDCDQLEDASQYDGGVTATYDIVQPLEEPNPDPEPDPEPKSTPKSWTPAETPLKIPKFSFKKPKKTNDEVSAARAEALKVGTRLAEEELILKKAKDRREEELHVEQIKKIKLECALLEAKLRKIERE